MSFFFDSIKSFFLNLLFDNIAINQLKIKTVKELNVHIYLCHKKLSF